MTARTKLTLTAVAQEMLILKASTVLMDNRTAWPRSIRRFIAMIEAHDPRLVNEQKRLRAEPYEAAVKTRRAIEHRWPR